jgi:hypothetical protein
MSHGTVIALGLPILLWVAAACFPGGLTVTDAVTANSFLIFISIFSLLTFFHAGTALFRRAFAEALIYGGFMFLLAQGVVWYGTRFTGEAGAGTGDQVVDYHREDKGPWCGDARIPARVEEIRGTGDAAAVEFSDGEKRMNVRLKGSFDWNGFRLSPVAIERAPLMSLETAAGEPVETLYIKMGTAPPERDFFLVKTLPHRIYIAPDGDRGIRLRIVRDKIEVVSTTVVWGEKLPYDGHVISFLQGEPWVRVAVEKKIPFWPVSTGAVLLLCGGAAYIRRKRMDQC